MDEVRVLVTSPDAAFPGAVRDIVAAQMPGATCDAVEVDVLRVKQVANALAIDARENPGAAISLAERQRAIGFTGAIALVATDDAVVANAARHGYAVVAPHELASQLVPQLAAQMLEAGTTYADQVMRARRLVAAGEIAAKLQHSLNNALMGLLAEAQLMQLDDLSEDHAAALERMVALCRRMIEMSRSLDGLADRKQTS